MGCLNDGTMGPVVRGCRNDFDFTVTFENVVFTLIPSAIFILCSLRRIQTLVHRRIVVGGSLFQLTKLILATSYAALSLAIVILLSNEPAPAATDRPSLSSAAVAFIASLCLILLSFGEHARSPRPSILAVAYLAATCLLDAAKARTLWLLHVAPGLSRTFTAMVALKAIMVVTESRQKTRWLTWEDPKHHSPEETSGLFNLGAFYWLHRLFISGYRAVLSFENLPPLDQTLSSSRLKSTFTRCLENDARSWRGHKYGLARILVSTLSSTLVPPMVPRVVLLAANMCQPLLIESLLEFLQAASPPATHGYGLIGATLLTYGLLAVSTALYWYFQTRFSAMVRGCLVAAIYEHTTRLELAAASDAGVITLMSTDVERVLIGILTLHEYWACTVQAGLSCWLLQRHLGAAWTVPLGIVLASVLGSFLLGKATDSSQRAWMQAIQRRVGVTAAAISEMKLIKMSGMAEPIRSTIQRLRIDEIDAGERWRLLLGASAGISQLPLFISPVITFAVALHGLDTTSIFVSLSYLTLLAAPLTTLIQKIPQLLAALACLDRIQSFLELGTRDDYRSHISAGPAIMSDGTVEMASLARSYRGGMSHISIRGGTFGWTVDTPVLKDVDVSVPSARTTAVIGPVASGKSTFVKSILGEIPYASGSVEVVASAMRGHVGYCDQQPFLTNASIRDNITGHGSETFDQQRYDQAIQATMLYRDLSFLLQGDRTIIGMGGIALSGGQRQRVSIARALYLANADLFIFDDVLSGLDASTESHVLQHVFGPHGVLARRRATVVLCTHKPAHLAFAHHVIKLDVDGSATEEDLSLPSAESTKIQAAKDPDSAEPELTKTLTIPSEAGQDLSRKAGDVQLYRHYAETVGALSLVLLALFGAAYGVFANFPRVWLAFWADDVARGPERAHSQGYYLGIYGLFQVLCVLGYLAAVGVALGPVIRSSGSTLHERALSTIVHAPLRLFTHTDLGVLTNFFSQDMTLIDNELPIALINLVLEVFSLVVVAAVVASSAPWLALMYPAMAVVLYLIQRFYLLTSRQLRLFDLEAKSPLYSHFLDTLKGITTMRASGWTGPNVERNLALLDESQRPAYLLPMVQRWLGFMLDACVALIATVLTVLITQLRPSSSLSGASLVTLMTLSEQLTTIVRYYTALETSLGAVARLKNFSAETEAERPDGLQPAKSWPSRGGIDVDGVWATYAKEDAEPEYVLKGVSLSIRPGERVALCGRTGSGKSSLVLLLLGFLDPADHGGLQGTVSVDGISLSDLDPQRLREQIITIPQDTVFLPPGSTVAQNLDPLGVSTAEQCRGVLVDLDLWRTVELQGGLDSPLAEGELSQGQRQMFSLARAVVRRRSLAEEGGGAVLLVDEFTSSVDVGTERRMMAAVEKEFRGCTVVMVAHRLDMVTEVCDRVFVVDHGRIAESGDPRVLGRMEGTWFASLLEAST